MAKEKGEKTDKAKRTEFKPDIKSATAIIGAIAFLQKTGFAATPKNIKTCIVQRSRKPADHIMEYLPSYLSRGLELGILRKFNGVYKIGKFNLRKRRRRTNVRSRVKKTQTVKPAENSDAASKKSSVCAC